MLTLATLGMAAYGLYSIAEGLLDLLWWSRLELWANAGVIVFGLLLLLAAAFVRVLIPGGLALALGALLGLQALSIHAAGGLHVWPQVARALAAAVLIALAWAGGRQPHAGVTDV